MWLNREICLFMIYSCIGWIYESTYCTLKTGKWENRGFLYGPACPIYGVGAVLVSLFASSAGRFGLAGYAPWQVFLVSVAGSAVLEYSTSWILEKLFHAVWWDYSHLPFNLHGRISLFSSLGFGVAGLLIYYYIAPLTEKLVSSCTPAVFQCAALLAVIIFTVDMTLTISALTRFEKMVIRAEASFNEKMESIVENAAEKVSVTEHAIAARKQAIENMASQATETGRSAVRRVREFRFRGVSKEKVSEILRDFREILDRRDHGRSGRAAHIKEENADEQ